MKEFCTTTTEVTALIERLFNDIKAGKELSKFRVGKRIPKGGRALADALVLEPAHKEKSVTLSEVISFIKGMAGEPRAMRALPKTVHPIHFEDFSGQQFEWLVYAFVKRSKQWNNLMWLGQTGSDGGRDIWGNIEAKSYCFQCANYQKLTAKKVMDDIDKLIRDSRKPDYFTVVCGGTCTPAIRDKITSYATSRGIQHTEIWSGRELEEKLRHDTPDLVQRFLEGHDLPDNETGTAQDDAKIVQQLFECFDRPAFTTGFRQEVNIPDFEKAITDTIEVLNTGVHRLRDGIVIRRISSRHEVSDNNLKNQLSVLTRQVIKLRDSFVQLKNEKEIRPCGCDQEDCPVWFFTDKAVTEMDKLRRNIFKQLRDIRPDFILMLH